MKTQTTEFIISEIERIAGNQAAKPCNYPREYETLLAAAEELADRVKRGREREAA
jgi:hypothetical protein